MFAVRNDGQGWRAIGSENDVGDQEYFSETEPVIEQTIADLIADSIRTINDEFTKSMQQVKGDVPADEITSWDKQESQARAWAADNTVVTPLIDSLATTRGIDKAELVDRIITKADLFEVISGQLIGTRQKLEAQLDVIAADEDATAEDVAAVVWPS